METAIDIFGHNCREMSIYTKLLTAGSDSHSYQVMALTIIRSRSMDENVTNSSHFQFCWLPWGILASRSSIWATDMAPFLQISKTFHWIKKLFLKRSEVALPGSADTCKLLLLVCLSPYFLKQVDSEKREAMTSRNPHILSKIYSTLILRTTRPFGTNFQ